MDRQRIDKWLWHARVVRTRSAAAALAAGGRIRVNGIRVTTASRPVRRGDVVTVAVGPVRVLRILGISERRGPASEAAQLCEIVEAESETRATAPPPEIQPQPSAAPGRPTKRERRDIVDLTRPGKG